MPGEVAGVLKVVVYSSIVFNNTQGIVLNGNLKVVKFD